MIWEAGLFGYIRQRLNVSIEHSNVVAQWQAEALLAGVALVPPPDGVYARIALSPRGGGQLGLGRHYGDRHRITRGVSLDTLAC